MTNTESSPANGGVIRLHEITKAFPGVIANNKVSLELHNAQVHCLLGENGAGKSTLISILAGLQLPDSGTISVDGTPVFIGSPRMAKRLGIGVVHQHSTLVPGLTVLENLMLGEPGFRKREKLAIQRLEELSDLLGARILPKTPAAELGLGQQQQVEIAKAMWTGTRLLILDEPTSMLTPSAIDALGESLTRLTARGLGVVLITHKLREAYKMGDCVTVLRGGRNVAHLSVERMATMDEDSARAEILRAMFGDELADMDDLSEAEEISGATVARREVSRIDFSSAPVKLRLDSVTTGARSMDASITDISLEIRAGEILGIAGIDGHGQTGLAEVVAGQQNAFRGVIELNGADITRLGVRGRQAAGVRYVTDDRLHEGTVANLPVSINLMLKRIGEAPFWRAGQIDKKAVNKEAERLIEEYTIRTPSPATRVGTLSGGNIQKVLLARELGEGSQVVVVNKPTAGLDLKTVRMVHDVLRDFAAGGGSVLLISTEMDELIQLSHRIAVISRGSIVGMVPNDGPDTAERVGAFMIGGAEDGAA